MGVQSGKGALNVWFFPQSFFCLSNLLSFKNDVDWTTFFESDLFFSPSDEKASPQEQGGGVYPDEAGNFLSDRAEHSCIKVRRKIDNKHKKVKLAVENMLRTSMLLHIRSMFMLMLVSLLMLVSMLMLMLMLMSMLSRSIPKPDASAAAPLPLNFADAIPSTLPSLTSKSFKMLRLRKNLVSHISSISFLSCSDWSNKVFPAFCSFSRLSDRS